MFCNKCGAQIAEGAAFCQKCGAKAVSVDAAQETQEPIDIPESDVKDQLEDTDTA